ncbi:MAG: AbrB/MazE/SpoVT family DNA-binding domain-containing protein [Gemmatimonadota bacterium]|nr:AbrB/MazE/SpoVT family DNA-binding domain-containing protein [Gemmatimonadota bacterium]
MAVSVKMSSKNQIVVPKVAREALSLEPGDRLVVTVEGETLWMQKLPSDLEERLEGMLGELASPDGLWAELVDE